MVSAYQMVIDPRHLDIHWEARDHYHEASQRSATMVPLAAMRHEMHKFQNHRTSENFYFTDKNFGTIDFDWEANIVSVSVRDENGE